MTDEQVPESSPSIEDKALRDTLDVEEAPRDPKLPNEELMNTVEINSVPQEGEHEESIISKGGLPQDASFDSPDGSTVKQNKRND